MSCPRTTVAETNPLSFSIRARSSRCSARTGELSLPHAKVRTPCFMPVGTQATVKGASVGDLSAMGYSLVLANTYHLHLRPGDERVARLGGIHSFSGWPGAVLTDSGGYQVFSLAKLRKIEEDGIRFQSHIDGASLYFTPERVMEVQRNLGADIAMVFDECVSYPCDHEYARRAMERTHRWAIRCAESHRKNGERANGGWPQALFAIVQGATYRELREESSRFVAGLDLPGYAIGGLAVGEERDIRQACISWCTACLPEDKPRYLMGVGTPADILDAVQRGVDMFDCVLPTRNGRTGQAYTSEGVLNLRNARYADDARPLDPACRCFVCANHTRAYLRHLFVSHEMLGPILATHHNLRFYANLMERIRTAIESDTLSELAAEMGFLQPDGHGNARTAPA